LDLHFCHGWDCASMSASFFLTVDGCGREVKRERRMRKRQRGRGRVDSPTPGLRKPINAIDLSVDEDTPRISHPSGPLGYPSPNQLQSCLYPVHRTTKSGLTSSFHPTSLLRCLGGAGNTAFPPSKEVGKETISILGFSTFLGRGGSI
jgi:hypothetical protein